MVKQYVYALAAPKKFFFSTGRYLPFIGFTASVALLVGVLWGLFFAPADYQQGDAFRIIYLHVPAAFLSMALYTGMGFLACLLLIWRIKIAGVLLPIVAQCGASMAILALVTGSIWGKPMWGTWWIWDARLTSELLLCMLYIAILAIYYAVSHREQSEKMIAIIILVGMIDLPIIHYSVYWWNTLHQGATLSLLAKPQIAPAMLYPLGCTLIGFSLFCGWIILSKARYEVLWRERRQQWVKLYVKSQSGYISQKEMR